MDDMKFPSKLFCGMDSLEKIYDGDYKSVLIISNGGAPMKTGSLLKIKRKFEMDETKAEIIISDSAPELFALTREYTEKNTPDIIIALGGGKRMTVPRQCQISAIYLMPHCLRLHRQSSPSMIHSIYSCIRRCRRFAYLTPNLLLPQIPAKSHMRRLRLCVWVLKAPSNQATDTFRKSR